MKYASNAVLALSRAFYGKRLTKEDYDAMLHCKSVGEIAQYLTYKTPYGAEITQSGMTSFQARGLEELVSKHRFSAFESLCRYEMAIGSAFYRYFILRDEIDQIERATLLLLGGNKEIYLERVNSFLDKHLSIDLFALGRANSLEEIALSLQKTAYGELYDKCLRAPKIDYLTFEQAFEGYFVKEVKALCKRCFSGGEEKTLQKLIARSLDRSLIECVWRAKRFYPSSTDLCVELERKGTDMLTLFSDRERKALAEAESVADVAAVIEKSAYRGWFDPKSARSIEYQLEQSLYDYCAKEIRFSSYPSVVMFCFLQLSRIETRNLVRIIEGIKFGVSPQVIEQNLIL